MRIAIVGGLERHEPEIIRRGSVAGHRLEFHRGRVGGRHAEELEATVERSDLVVIVTQVNSHGAMNVAKRTARRTGCAVLIVRNCGPARFQLIVDALASDSRERELALLAG